MEKPNCSSSSGKQRRRKIEVKGDGVGGLLLVGGGIAAAALIAAIFASKSNKKRPFNKSAGPHQNSVRKFEHNSGGSSSNKFRVVEEEEEEEEAGEGLLCIAQIPSPSIHYNLCCRSTFEHGASGTGSKALIESMDSKAVEARIMEDGSEAGSHWKSVDGNDDTVKKEDHIENHLSVEAPEEIEGDESSKAVHNVDQMIFEENPSLELQEQEDQMIFEENSSLQLQQEEDGSEDDDGVDEKESEEGSEATGDSSLESNSESIWPAESIDEESLELKAIRNQIQTLSKNSGKAYDAVEDDEGEIETNITETKTKLKESNMRHKLLLYSFLAVLLLLLLLAHHVARACYVEQWF